MVEKQDAYLRAHKREAQLIDGTTRPVLDLLGDACDEALKTTFRSPSDATTKLSACSEATFWINCNDKTDGPAYKSCPLADKTKWNARFTKAADIYRAFSSHQAIDYANSISRLEDTRENALTVVKTQLSTYITRSPQPLSFELAFRWISTFGANADYAGASPRSYILEYRNRRAYEFEYGSIINGHIILFQQGELTGGELGSAFGGFFDDERLDLGNKLMLENTTYRAGYFE